MSAALAPMDKTVGVLAPTLADAEIAASVLREAGIGILAYGNFEELCSALGNGIGAVVLVEEALSAEHLDRLASIRRSQPPWSSTPFIVLTRPHSAAARQPGNALATLPNALLIERPVRIENLLSAIRSSLDARSKQYAMRDLLEEARRSAAERSQLLKAAEDSRQQAEAANRMKDEFLAVLSHELRTPMNAILGWAALLRRKALTAEQTERAVESIERNSRLQAQLIDDLLDVSRVISGSLRLDLQPIELEAVVAEAIATVTPASANKGVKIKLIGERAGNLVRADSARLQQIIWNLLVNAIKFTPRDGTISVTIASEPGRVQVEIADTGEGIAPEFLPHVFERFRQADSSTTRQRGGLGLGLAIVRQLVELHGGAVEARSAGRGLGATFIVRLPLIEVAEETRHAGQRRTKHRRAGSLAASAQPLAGRVILLIDDDPESLQMASAAVSASGARVHTAESAAEGVALATAIGPHAVVCDISMPGEDGYSFMRRLKSMGDVGANIPAIALTAHARDEDKRAALDAGFALHLAKPVDPAELVRAVTQLVRPSS